MSKGIMIAVLVVILLVVVYGGVAAFLMVLWNFVIPEMFGLPELDFWKSLALLFICSLLFKGGSSSSK